MSLRAKLLILSLFLALIPLGLAGRNLIRITQDELKSAANDDLLATAQRVASDIDAFYQSAWLAPITLVKASVESPNLGVNEKLSLMTEAVSNVEDFVAMQISVQGVPRPLLITQDTFSQTLRQQTDLDPIQLLQLDPGQIESAGGMDSMILGEPVFVEGAQTWLLPIMLPLSMETFGRPAALSAQINLSHLKSRIDEVRSNRSGSITLVDEKGARLFDTDTVAVVEAAIVKAATSLLADGNRSNGVLHSVNPDGESMLGAYAFPNSFDWAIIVEKPLSEAYLAVSDMVSQMVIWIAVGIFIAFIGAIWLSVSLTKPIRKLMTAAKEVASGDLSKRTEGSNRKDEIGQLSGAFNQMVDDLNLYIDKLTETTKAKERADAELMLAQEIQQSFLPKKFPQFEELDVFGTCESAREVGGDYFDVFMIGEKQFGMVIGDVSGKGIPAALFMAVSRTLFRILATKEKSPSEVLVEFNDRLVEMDQGTNMFITMFFGVFNLETRILTYSTAGHNMPYISGPRGRENTFQMLPTMETMVAGMMEGMTMGLEHIHLRRDNDTLVLYTDGMTEAINQEGEEYGDDRLAKQLEKYSSLPAKEMVLRLVEDVKAYQKGMPQFDDMTLFIMKLKSLSNGNGKLKVEEDMKTESEA